MKIKNILICGLGAMALTACNDYLDVDAPSKYTTDYVFSNATAVNSALNGLYTKALSDNAFGKTYVESLMLNSDVDFKTFSSANSGTNNIRRFDCDANSSTVKSAWNQAYSAIDACNTFIYYLEQDKYNLLEGSDSAEVKQMLGEAKCIRAMFYNELTEYWGDVPAPLEPVVETSNMSPAMQSRDDIRWTMVQDLLEVAPKMKSAKDLKTNERFSEESCRALAARIALNAGGYSLRHNDDDATSYGFMSRPTATTYTDLRNGNVHQNASYTDFYQIARDEAKKVIDAGTFSLSKTFSQVFVDECNFKGYSDFDDPMMELPFARESSGNVGYLTGPKMASSDGKTDHNWGEAGGSVQLSHFYPYTFDSDDQRGSYLKGAWQYTYQTVPSLSFSFTWYNNKWSKLWNEEGLGSETTGSTGINYPYIRYADVLLMFAEADNELNGPTQDAVDQVNKVRERAYQSTSHALAVPASKEAFLDSILSERAKEFAGENMRWKDLVRNNKYSEEIYWTFMRYFGVASDIAGGGDYTDLIDEHDGKTSGFYSKDMPHRLYWCYIKNPGAAADTYKPIGDHGVWVSDTIDGNVTTYELNLDECYKYVPRGQYYTQTSSAVPVIYYVSAQSKPKALPQTYITDAGLDYTVLSQSEINTLLTNTSKEWNEAILSWDNDGVIKNEIRYSLFGYIRYDDTDKIYVVNNGNLVEIADPNTYNTANLPVIRYLLPIPREAITRSGNQYKNYYGY